MPYIVKLLLVVAAICLVVTFFFFVGGKGKAPDDKSVTEIHDKSFKNGLGMEMVCLSKGYYVSRYETTQEQFKKIMGYNHSIFPGENHPIENITVDEAEEFCVRLSIFEKNNDTLPDGYVYHLPTRKQWLQYFAGSPLKNSITPGGGNPKWTDEHSLPVGSGEVNRLGLYDLWGNLTEWSSDIYEPELNTHVTLGHDFYSYGREPYDYPAIKQGSGKFNSRALNLGFRCVLVKKIGPVDTTEDTSLHRAATIGDIARVRELAGRENMLDAKNRWGSTPLHRASLWGHLDVVKALVEARANINSKDMYDNTPLHFAIVSGKFEIAEYLIGKGADPNIRNSWGEVPLYLAVEVGHLELVKKLLSNKALVDPIEEENGWTPLLEAVNTGNAEIVRILIDAGADVNLNYGTNGWTPLERARKKKHKEIAEYLKEHGAKE